MDDGEPSKERVDAQALLTLSDLPVENSVQELVLRESKKLANSSTEIQSYLGGNELVLTKSRPRRKSKPCSEVRDIISDPRFVHRVYYEDTPRGPNPRGYIPKASNDGQQNNPQQRAQLQMNFMESLATNIPPFTSPAYQLDEKEAFRVRLLEITTAAIIPVAESCGVTLGPSSIRIKCIGSLRNGLALPESNVDLVLIFRDIEVPEPLQNEIPGIVERAYIEAGLGARRAISGGCPILQICEKPSKELLEALKAELEARDEHNHNPASPVNSDGSSTFPGDAGIICNLHFFCRLPIYNTELLRCYSLCDERVRRVVTFVKHWARCRKINDPERGTLSSYGYTLMALHYLTNVVAPPVVPNLQIIYHPHQRASKKRRGKAQDGNLDSHVEGCDVRFFDREEEIVSRSRKSAPTGNRQSVGDLLRGFFAYYSQRPSTAQTAPGSRKASFDWVNWTISIRTRGGLLSKDDKNWTRARFINDGVHFGYQYNLLAIEDPFQLDHNVAQTVTRAGISAIRSEFIRAHMIINRVQETPRGWVWYKDDGEPGEDFFAPPEGNTGYRVSVPPPPSADVKRDRQVRPARRGRSGGARRKRLLPTPGGDLQTRTGAHPVDNILIPLREQQPHGLTESG